VTISKHRLVHYSGTSGLSVFQAAACPCRVSGDARRIEHIAVENIGPNQPCLAAAICSHGDFGAANTEHFLHRLISRLRSFSGIAQGFLEPSNSATDSGTEIENVNSPNFELIRKCTCFLR